MESEAAIATLRRHLLIVSATRRFPVANGYGRSEATAVGRMLATVLTAGLSALIR